MSKYVELPIDQIELDKSNPRIANYLATHDEDDITSDLMALLLGTTSDSCASLRQSIEANYGIIHPIVVNKRVDGTYVVIEGNTRLQIYKDFRRENKPGNWDTIRCLVYENIDAEEMHKIRLQAHLVGPREWDPYSKAKYLNYLANIEHMPMASLISFCGGSSKASEIRNMIAAFNDMEKYYRPLCDDDTQFDIKKFHGFVELQRSSVIESLTLNGYTKTDFSQWMIDDKFSILQDVRRIPEILKSKKATEVFLKSDTASAKKILAVEELSSDKLKDIPYELLAKELSKRMQNILLVDIHHLRSDSDYADKLTSLMNVYDDVKFVLDEVNGED